jgi:GNAT superfamily N-acetyltransferase
MGTYLRIRVWNENDDISALTWMLHRAYKPLADMGLRFLATHQDDAVTLERISKGLTFLGEVDGNVIATVTLVHPSDARGCTWYDTPKVAYFGQLAVEPEFQKHGIAAQLLDRVESEAKSMGAAELGLDTSEKAFHLIAYYRKRGYRFIEHVQWPDTNYRSVIMSKTLE